MISNFLPDVSHTSEFDMLREIYEADCDSVMIASSQVIMEHALLVSGNDENILMEGLSDVAKSIGEWFKKMIDAIKTFFTKFIKIFTDFTLNLREFVVKNKTALLDSKINTTITGFKFSVLDSPTPDMSAFDKLIASYNSLLSGIDTLDAGKLKHDSMEFLSVDHLSVLRGQVLGSKGAIPEDTFLKDVRKFYRGGDEDAVSVTVDSSYIRDIVTHVDSLFDAKKKAIADRDRILKLLKTAENFFSSKVILSYDGNTSRIKTRSLSGSINDSNGVKAEDGDTISYNDGYKKISALMNAKYNETRELSKIINVVITERANAFRDQVKQERKVVAMAMRPIPKVTNEATELWDDEDIVDENTNYDAVSSELDFISGPVIEALKFRNLCREANWYKSAMEGNYDYVAMEGLISSLANGLQDLVIRISSMFRKKAKATTKKYRDWFDDDGVVDAIKANAKKTSLDLKDYWGGDHNRQMEQIADAFNKCFQETNDMTKCPFSSTFVKDTDIETIKKYGENRRDLSNVMKNYFRCGKPGIDKMENVTLAGSQLESKIDSMIDYVGNFDKFSEKLVDLEARAKNLKLPVEEGLILWLDSYLNIEGRKVMESDLGMTLPLLPGFSY
ncbi:MAG: hypothetical protein NC548_29805, partial [Lachnospiraceae bacterium]|nr:hypothetical protein [Lachnospiraceae bacterium]